MYGGHLKGRFLISIFPLDVPLANHILKINMYKIIIHKTKYNRKDNTRQQHKDRKRDIHK